MTIPAARSWSDDRYEYREILISRHISVGAARAMLTEHAEYGKWELARTVLYVGGARRVMLRRRTMRMRLTSHRIPPV